MKFEAIIKTIIVLMREHSKGFELPLIQQITNEYGHDPYLMLIGCLLSLRARDSMTIHVCRDLFNRVRTPEALLAMPLAELEKIINRITYYHTKALVLRGVSYDIITRFNGKVPNDHDALLSMKGVGPKTANLVMGLGFDVPSICVDTHVHRISNRLGLIQTKTPEQTEEALKTILPKEFWIEYNKLLVMWGQNICAPISPKCSKCAVNHLCKKVGVTTHR